ncbi:hypothetical protein LTR94_028769, partial [Friedmanniomyces endolithicus]
MAPPLDVAVVIPTFNERANVAALVARLDVALAGLAWEAIVVDDDSPDGTADAARALALADPRVRLSVVGATDGSAADVDPVTHSAVVLAADRARAAAALRGLLVRPFLRGGSGIPAFVGRHVRLKTRGMIRLGKGATLGDG